MKIFFQARFVDSFRSACFGALSFAIALALASLSPARAGAEPDPCADVASVVARIQARYDQVQDIEADFEQTTRSVMLAGAGLGDDAPTRGHMQIAKPGRMRWTYTTPRASLVLSDGETLWIYDVEAGEVTRASVTEGYLAGAALQFLLGDGAIVDAFHPLLAGCSDLGIELVLVPKEAASYEKLGLLVDRSSGVVLGTTIYDLFGNVTQLRFAAIRFDQKPSPEVFEWSSVDGVRVVDLVPVAD